jgi:hypothetical protein
METVKGYAKRAYIRSAFHRIATSSEYGLQVGTSSRLLSAVEGGLFGAVGTAVC